MTQICLLLLVALAVAASIASANYFRQHRQIPVVDRGRLAIRFEANGNLLTASKIVSTLVAESDDDATIYLLAFIVDAVGFIGVRVVIGIGRQLDDKNARIIGTSDVPRLSR